MAGLLQQVQSQTLRCVRVATAIPWSTRHPFQATRGCSPQTEHVLL